jgi:hypothetical protein
VGPAEVPQMTFGISVYSADQCTPFAPPSITCISLILFIQPWHLFLDIFPVG